MRNISKEELNKILKEHELWLKREGGKRADLINADLRYTNLSYADLRHADLIYANLRYVDLSNTNLSDANLRHADLSNADLSNANLRRANLARANLQDADLVRADISNVDLSNANLQYTDLKRADLSYSNLKYADLRYTNLSDTNLRCADLRYANLEYVKTNIHTIGYNLACPEEGSFIGYKKANECIVKLLILEDSKRSSATSVKCRCDKAKVLEIENIKTGEKLKEIRSNYDNNFIYRVGEIVTVSNFDNDRWNECSTGIHFFMNRDNAIKY